MPLRWMSCLGSAGRRGLQYSEYYHFPICVS